MTQISLDKILEDVDIHPNIKEAIRHESATKEEEVNFWRAYSSIQTHDMKADLIGLVGYIEYLNFKKEISSEEVKKIIERMSRISSRLMSYNQESTHFSHAMQSGIIKKDTINLSDIAKGVVEDIRDSTSSDSEFKIGENIVVHGDMLLLRKLMRNLLGNALKYSSVKDKPVIEYGLLTEDGAKVHYVKDNGIGFDQSKANLLFRPFVRLHGGSEIKGDGIGLYSAKKIIDLHRGTIRAEGEIGNGATIYFTLPKSN